MPTLERMMRFTAQRQQLIAHNLANLDTPDFTPLDVSPTSFQAQLRRAVEERRERTGGMVGEMRLEGTREVRVHGDRLELRPGTPTGNIAYHDRNSRDLERTMQDLAENGLAFRLASDLYRRENDVLRVAITQRV